MSASNALFALMMGPISDLNALMQLKDGWNYGQGVRPSSIAHIHALALTLSTADAGAEKFEFFPEDDGGILTIVYRGDESIEFLAKGNGGFEIAFEDKIGLSPAKEFATFPDVQNELGARGWQLQKSSDSFTRVISASERTATHPWRFGRAGAASQSSTLDALLGKGIQFVPMQNVIIPDVSAVPPQYSGVSQRRNLLLEAS